MSDSAARHRTDAKRKQRVYAELAELESVLEKAGPDSLPWEFWCRILETVEELPESEQQAWKAKHIAHLRRAVAGVRERDETARPDRDRQS